MTRKLLNQLGWLALAFALSACDGAKGTGPGGSGAGPVDVLAVDGGVVAPDVRPDTSAAPETCVGDGCSDPCAAVACDEPPDVCHEASGTCKDGTCEYAPLDGSKCDDGDPCTVDDACAAGVCAGVLLACDAPPGAECKDGPTLLVSAGPGECKDGACEYETSEVPCDVGCEDGGCLGDPCAGVTCETPPGPCYASVGTCSSGSCIYEPLKGGGCDDSDPCTIGDSCEEGLCVGSPVTCDDPPSAECLAGDILHVYASPGLCDGQGCVYATTDIQCPGPCVGGKCVSDACAGVVCDKSPGPCYAATGTCQGGKCVYEPASGGCDDGDPCTTGDACEDGECVGTQKTCKTPPEAACLDGDTLSTWSSSGVCVGGECTYAEATVSCPGGCAGAKCVGDACAGVTCNKPPSACYASDGWCDGGACNYALIDGATCDDGNACTVADTCQSGACKGKAKACDSPPDPTCQGGSTQVVYASKGTCGAGGVCEYGQTTKTCPSGCADGACSVDPCAGITCDSPQNECFEATGTCNNGACSYPYADGTPCSDGQECTIADACQSGTCSGSTKPCNAPPPAVCDGDTTLITYAAVGTCEPVSGGCDHAEVPLSCGFGCVDGSCVGDPCAGKTCASPPGPKCISATVLRTFAGSGVCADGLCSYAPTDTTCPLGCANGACEAPKGIVISEVLYDSAGADTDTFVEIHGPAGTDLGGFTLYGVKGTTGATYQSIQLAGKIGSDGLFVVAHPDATPWILDLADQLDKKVDYQNGPDSVVLAFDGAAVDALAYGVFGAGEIAAGEGAPADDTPAGSALARDGEYTDTNDNATDFVVLVAPTPGAPNELTCPDGALLCDGACVDPATSSDYCGAATCTKAPCKAGETCVGGVCTSGCTDACTAGAKKCQGMLVQVCAKGTSGCLEWGPGAACAGGGSCAGAGQCGKVIATDTTLCGEQVFDGPLTVQGGAKVSCPSGELTIRAQSIFVDPSSSIDLSATSSVASGASYAKCTGPCNSNGINTGASGGGNGTQGGAGHSTKFEIKNEVSCGGWWGWSCKTCNGPSGGPVKDTATGLALSPGGMGGTGCGNVLAGSLGTCYQGDFRPGGKGGGVIRLFAETEIKVLGQIHADGGDGISTLDDDAGPGGGAGGGILLYAPKVTVSGTISAAGGTGGSAKPYGTGDCASDDGSGGAGGSGRVKILYGTSLDVTGQVQGAVESISYAPPVSVTSSTHPDLGLHYNDTFDALELSWEPPFQGALGYWYLVSDKPVVTLTPGNGTFTEATSVTVPAATFTSAGTWYVHILSVAPNAEVGTVSSTFSFMINDLPPVVSSSSHPDQGAWYAQTALTFSWAPPAGVAAESFGGYWYRLDHVKDEAPGKAGAGYAFTENAQVLLTKDSAGQAVAPGTYYLHVVAEDTIGKLTKVAAAYQVQIGPKPETMNFYGYVTGPGGGALQGVEVGLEPYGLKTTTDANGYFIFEGIFRGAYALTATLAGHPTYEEAVDASPENVPYSFEMQ